MRSYAFVDRLHPFSLLGCVYVGCRNETLTNFSHPVASSGALTDSIRESMHARRNPADDALNDIQLTSVRTVRKPQAYLNIVSTVYVL